MTLAPGNIRVLLLQRNGVRRRPQGHRRRRRQVAARSREPPENEVHHYEVAAQGKSRSHNFFLDTDRIYPGNHY
jgi:hypothetical protein